MTNQKDCEFCREKFSETVIREYENWVIQLFLDQKYLGRTLIKLNRHAVDLTELKKHEREELFEKVLPDLKQATDKMFEPDLYNQATLGNECRHFHIHFIPRYRTERKFNGEKFTDENWNNHYKNSDESDVSEETFNKILEEMMRELEK